MNINKGSKWRYYGESLSDATRSGYGFIHKIIEVSSEGILTWSEPSRQDGEGGWSWFGPALDFLRQFKPA